MDAMHDSTDATNAVWQCGDIDGDCAFGICDSCFRRQHSGRLDVTLMAVGMDDEHAAKRMDADERGCLADLLEDAIASKGDTSAFELLLEWEMDDAAEKCDRTIEAFRAGGAELDEVKRAVQFAMDAEAALLVHRDCVCGRRMPSALDNCRAH